MLLDEGLEERNSLYLLVLLRTDVLSSQHNLLLEAGICFCSDRRVIRAATRGRAISSSEQSVIEGCPSSNPSTAGDEEEHDPHTKLLLQMRWSSLEHEYMLTTTDFTLSFLCLQAVKECHEHSHRASFQNGCAK